MATGTVKWFNGEKGDGFIAPDAGGQDVFVHASATAQAGMRSLTEGQKIEYEVVSDKRTGKRRRENFRQLDGCWRQGSTLAANPRETIARALRRGQSVLLFHVVGLGSATAVLRHFAGFFLRHRAAGRSHRRGPSRTGTRRQRRASPGLPTSPGSTRRSFCSGRALRECIGSHQRKSDNQSGLKCELLRYDHGRLANCGICRSRSSWYSPIGSIAPTIGRLSSFSGDVLQLYCGRRGGLCCFIRDLVTGNR